MTSLAVSRVSALRHLCQYFNLAPPDEVKKKAKWVTPDVEKDGVVKALEKFVLQE